MPQSHLTLDLTTADLPLANPAGFRSVGSATGVDLYTLRSNKLTTQITNFGGRIVNLFVPDRHGRPDNVVLGFNHLDGYLSASERYYGAIIGRVANRINEGRFVLDGKEVALATNDGPHHLHGGNVGFDNAIWYADQIDERTLKLDYVSRDMEEGYPGSLSTTVTYKLFGDSGIEISYNATTDAPTIVNLTNHAYFNLSGAGAGPITEHQISIEADHFTPVGDELIPTGEIAPVAGTPMDFRVAVPIGIGYDHNYVLRRDAGTLRRAARVIDPKSGRRLEVLTDAPGMQFYTGNFFDGTDVGASGKPHRYRESFALETQHFPDGPNQSAFPSIVLRPGERYRSTTRYLFSVDKFA
jgi:aldose 1-epimerase